MQNQYDKLIQKLQALVNDESGRFSIEEKEGLKEAINLLRNLDSQKVNTQIVLGIFQAFGPIIREVIRQIME